MKSINWTKILLSVLIVAVVLFAVGFAAGAVLAPNNVAAAGIPLGGFAAVMGTAFYIVSLTWGGSSRKARKLLDAKLEENNFSADTEIFKTSNAFLAIDKADGKIGYVANLNNKEYQQTTAKELSKVKSSFKKAMGGASAVYFEFYYNGKRTRIYTFLSNGAISLKSEDYINAQSKADYYSELLGKLGASC